MTSITLGAILRAVFGAEGPALDELRDLVPPMVTACRHGVNGAAEAAARPGPVESVGPAHLGTGAVSTLSSTRLSPMRGSTRLGTA